MAITNHKQAIAVVSELPKIDILQRLFNDINYEKTPDAKLFQSINNRHVRPDGSCALCKTGPSYNHTEGKQHQKMVAMMCALEALVGPSDKVLYSGHTPHPNVRLNKSDFQSYWGDMQKFMFMVQERIRDPNFTVRFTIRKGKTLSARGCDIAGTELYVASYSSTDQKYSLSSARNWGTIPEAPAADTEAEVLDFKKLQHQAFWPVVRLSFLPTAAEVSAYEEWENVPVPTIPPAPATVARRVVKCWVVCIYQWTFLVVEGWLIQVDWEW